VGDVEAAVANAAAAREELLGSLGRTVAVADVSTALAAYELARHNLDAARTFALEAVAIAVEFEVPARLAAPLEQLAVIAKYAGNAPQAARFFGFADTLRRSRALPRLAREVPGYDDARARTATALGSAEFAALVARGASSPESQITSEALRPGFDGSEAVG
jgi:hypothetical protein